ncbi:hypothetical protein MHI24_17425 [Paenibacillus sp. FSL K6-1096]|uniref:hypothetical protein n=1 Tax=Paenibacillus sp. FSL K6-1096 TaxID=2921460 RepID=UPI0030EED406
MAKDNSFISSGNEIEFIKNERGELILPKFRVATCPDQVRPEVIGAYCDVFEEDLGILEDLRNR